MIYLRLTYYAHLAYIIEIWPILGFLDPFWAQSNSKENECWRITYFNQKENCLSFRYPESVWIFSFSSCNKNALFCKTGTLHVSQRLTQPWQSCEISDFSRSSFLLGLTTAILQPKNLDSEKSEICYYKYSASSDLSWQKNKKKKSGFGDKSSEMWQIG